MKFLLNVTLAVFAFGSFANAGEFAFASAQHSYENEGKIQVRESDAQTSERLSGPDANDIDRQAKSVGCSTTGCTIRCTTSCTTRCTTNCSRLLDNNKKQSVLQMKSGPSASALPAQQVVQFAARDK